ncbi:JAB-like toxin 1 domain-containing protein [Litoribacter populi]|uniref:JAB-like toxin 1 domain-containing protein n=1 Tax=Litoribacter populi TaxID=2598460 RepID=UPI00117E0885|nr:JAB-like toxin 1 domain-containing protein [Litoribacter populi]
MGNILGIYKNDTLIEQTITSDGRLGSKIASSEPGYRTLGGKMYELSNHLGNVLAVVSDNINMSADSTWASSVSISDYYPFGLAMEGRSFQDTTFYRYGFNGMELDNAWKGAGRHYTTEWRQYDPRIGRWMSVDPLMSKMPEWSSYNFGFNNPMRFTDLRGLAPDDYQLQKNGEIKLIRETNDDFDVLYASNQDGSPNDLQLTILEKGILNNKETKTVMGVDNEKYTFDLYNITGDLTSKNLFEFVSNHSDVEWSLTRVGLNKGSSGNNFLSTSRLKDREVGGGYLFYKGFHLREHTHSHPYRPLPSLSDVDLAEKIINKFPNSRHFIYHKHLYHEFTPNK